MFINSDSVLGFLLFLNIVVAFIIIVLGCISFWICKKIYRKMTGRDPSIKISMSVVIILAVTGVLIIYSLL